MEADLSKHGLPVLRGVLDLVRAGGRIVDFKTTGKTPDAFSAGHQHEIQTSSYSVLYRDATGRKESGIELHHLVKLKQPKLVVTAAPPMTEQQQTRLFKQMESYVYGVQRQDFVPRASLLRGRLTASMIVCACSQVGVNRSGFGSRINFISRAMFSETAPSSTAKPNNP